MKITVVTPVFGISGVPLAQVRFARALAGRGHDVELIVGHLMPGYQFPDVGNVRLIHMEKRRVRSMLLPLIGYLRRRRPDVVFSAEDHLNAVTLLAAMLAGSSAKISCSSRVTPFDTYSKVPFTKRWFLKHFMRAVMPRATVLTCVAKDMVDQYRQVFDSAPHVCVYNIVSHAHALEQMREPVDDEWFTNRNRPLIVAAGTLAPWKGFPYLIEAFSLLRQSRDARLVILGDGPSRAELEAMVERLGLTGSVKMPGFVSNPLKYFSRADVFALSSLVEGMPNVLVEAMMCGCTPVSTDCPTGPRELLQGGRYGYLVPVRDPAALAQGMLNALERPIPKEILAEAVREFTEQAVIGRHFELLGVSG
jgi:glycosyltransferase involved in cell wall biosynthesis